MPLNYNQRAFIDPFAQARMDALAQAGGIYDPTAGAITSIAPFVSRGGNIAVALASQFQNVDRTTQAIQRGGMNNFDAAKLLTNEFLINPILTVLMHKYLKPAASTELKKKRNKKILEGLFE